MRWVFRASRRLIPASAGSTIPEVAGRVKQAGSSPRLRGALGRHDGDRGELRLIPASAGSTIDAIEHHLVVWAHPRVCGEH